MFIRLMDDWAYQANIRKYVRESTPDFLEALNEKTQNLKECENKIANYLDFDYNDTCYSLPWNRSFEVEINVHGL